MKNRINTSMYSQHGRQRVVWLREVRWIIDTAAGYTMRQPQPLGHCLPSHRLLKYWVACAAQLVP